MRARRASVLLSVLFHATLVGTLAILRPPGNSAPPVEPGRVILRLVPPAPVNQGTSTPASASRTAGMGSEAVPDAGLPDLGPIARDAGLRPSITELDARASAAVARLAAPPLPRDRLAPSRRPSASDVAAARLPPEGARPVPSPLRGSASQAAMAPPTVAAPGVLPDPGELVREMRGAGAPAPAATGTTPVEPQAGGGSVEPELRVRGRSPRSQPALEFPAVLSREGREADVTAEIGIDSTGAVVRIRIAVSSGDSTVDSAVERILRGYLFDPVDSGTIDEGTVTFHFRLKDRF